MWLVENFDDKIYGESILSEIVVASRNLCEYRPKAKR